MTEASIPASREASSSSSGLLPEAIARRLTQVSKRYEGKKTEQIQVYCSKDLYDRAEALAADLYNGNGQGGGNLSRLMRDALLFFEQHLADEGVLGAVSVDGNEHVALVRVTPIGLGALRILYPREFEEVMEI